MTFLHLKLWKIFVVDEWSIFFSSSSIPFYKKISMNWNICNICDMNVVTHCLYTCNVWTILISNVKNELLCASTRPMMFLLNLFLFLKIKNHTFIKFPLFVLSWKCVGFYWKFKFTLKYQDFFHKYSPTLTRQIFLFEIYIFFKSSLN